MKYQYRENARASTGITSQPTRKPEFNKLAESRHSVPLPSQGGGGWWWGYGGGGYILCADPAE